jgi:hypothetical protein
MTKDFVTVATCQTAEEAHMLRNGLEAAGIRAFLSDELTTGMIWVLNNALGGVKVQVAAADVAAARAVLEAEPLTNEQLAEIEAPEADVSEECGDEASVVQSAADPAGDEFPPELPGDVLARRALVAAILGFYLCPPLLHFYSLWTLLKLGFSDHEVSPAGNRKQIGAFIIDLGVLAVLFMIIRFL